MYPLSQLSEIYEAHARKSHFNQAPAGLYDPVRHIMGMKGKRIRPMLLLMSCELFGGNIYDALDPAFAIEVFHNFTLVHDDIMDKADIRRGIPTVHKQFGTNAAILAGDVMLSYAYRHLCQIDDRVLKPVLSCFNETSILIYEGQQLDVDFEQRNDVTVQEYLRMIEYKTSVLLGGALQIGAILAGASEEDQRRIYKFGIELGLSFQIQDDLLDTFGEGEKVGKKIGGDIIQNKKTYLLIQAINRSDADGKIELFKALEETDADRKVEKVLGIFEALEIRKITSQKVQELYEQALISLEEISVPKERKEALLNLAEMLNGRAF